MVREIERAVEVARAVEICTGRKICAESELRGVRAAVAALERF